MVIENYSCADREDHEGHPTTGTRSFTCTGTTPCGEKTHEPHYLTQEVELWCRGICRCPAIAGIHNPGVHR